MIKYNIKFKEERIRKLKGENKGIKESYNGIINHLPFRSQTTIRFSISQSLGL